VFPGSESSTFVSLDHAQQVLAVFFVRFLRLS
jgi:hypothetical protein